MIEWLPRFFETIQTNYLCFIIIRRRYACDSILYIIIIVAIIHTCMSIFSLWMLFWQKKANKQERHKRRALSSKKKRPTISNEPGLDDRMLVLSKWQLIVCGNIY